VYVFGDDEALARAIQAVEFVGAEGGADTCEINNK
jgi:hypothetical protein